jgi:hypothetical protein
VFYARNFSRGLTNSVEVRGPRERGSGGGSFSSCTGPRWLVPPEVLQPAGLLYEPGFRSSRLYRQELPRLRLERRLAGKGKIWLRNVRLILPSNSEFHAF